MSINYVYLVGSLIFFAIWLIFFILRKDLRREMLIVSIPGAILQYVGCKYWCIIDWWNPYTLFGRGVGFEDFLFGFSSFGIAAVIYDVLLHKKYARHIWKKPRFYIRIYFLILIIAFLSLALFASGTTSFTAYVSVAVISSSILLISHHQLFTNSLLSGLLFMLISVPIYLVLNALSPGWIEHTYLFDSLSGIRIFTIPLEEYLYYFVTGLIIGPLFEYSKRV